MTKGGVVLRIAYLDSIKGVAILMVIAIHCIHRFEIGAAASVIDALARPAVGVFLFISGYLFSLRDVDFKKRILRLFPAYLFFTAIFLYKNSSSLDFIQMLEGFFFWIWYILLHICFGCYRSFFFHNTKNAPKNCHR
ncbi:acyltransferase family protein [Desulfomicrobium baculatum]|uniref:acyltransferase family protein n=1 Tax=Desulfomicrobium baculatum TaxID=899 RepID=UPI0009D70C23